MSRLQFIFDGGTSKRYHTVDTLRIQDIAAHSFGVAWLCELLTEEGASKNLIMAALAHDLAEHQCGDIPSPVKRRMGVGHLFHAEETKLLHDNQIAYEILLTPEEKLILKQADMIEGMLFCLRERQLGNTKIEEVYGRFSKYAMEDGPVAGTAMNILLEINDQWEDLVNVGACK